MSKVYGTLTSDKGSSTRAGHRYIEATAQSWEGSVTVSIEGGEAAIAVASGSATGGREIWRGKLADLVAAHRLHI